FETALQQFHSYTGDPIASIDLALAADPDFAIGHLLKAFGLFTTSEQRFLPMVKEAVAAAGKNETRLTPRERGMLAAARNMIDGRWSEASRAFDEVLIDHPRDALTIQTAHLMDFFQGDALNLRNRVSRVLPAWSASTPGYSYVLGMHAFGLEECNQYAEAEQTARRALDIQPKDGWSVHAVTHVMEMQGRIDDGIAWLTSREQDWAPDNMFAPHNWWHLALFHLDRGDHAAALALYDQKLDTPQADMILVLLDATALLWRLKLDGADIGDRFEKVADLWQGKLELERGFYAFNDVHAMMSFAVTGRAPAIEQLLVQMREAARDTNSNAMMTREVGLPLAQGMLDFSRGRYVEAIDAISRVRDGANRFGGSHAQRDILTLTLIDAAIRAGQMSRARHYIAERQVHKPTAWSERLLARTLTRRTAEEPAMA
ncbi:MAG: tetratricopeptide repeat protein, partial [Burkholderiaceae bacterium]